MNWQFTFWSFSLGALSAISLMIGSLLGVIWRPRQILMSSFTAFGAGALLAALSIELMAPTVLAVAQGTGGANGVNDFAGLVLGAIGGGILFVVLDQLVNAQGGYLRKSATIVAYWTTSQKRRRRAMLRRLSEIDFLRAVPAEHIETLVSFIRPVIFAPGATIFKKNDEGDCLYFIESGEVIISNRWGKEVDRVHAGDIIGEIALLTGAPRTANASAANKVVMLQILKRDFERLCQQIPHLKNATEDIAGKRLAMLAERQKAESDGESEWLSQAAHALRQGVTLPSTAQLQTMAKEESGAPMAIWLGIMLDGVPESFVIGSSFLALTQSKALAGGAINYGDVVPYSLIAGLFLSNFPEALSSSVTMKQQGWKSWKVVGLWASILLMTAIGAALGYALGASLEPGTVCIIQGVAAGAMLTMIAQTMIPEAVVLGGHNLVGLSTLGGFLAVIVFKLLE